MKEAKGFKGLLFEFLVNFLFSMNKRYAFGSIILMTSQNTF